MTHHFVPNCAKCRKDRTGAHFSHTIITFCTFPAETIWCCCFTVLSLGLSAAIGTDQLGEVHTWDSPQCGCIQSFISYKSACMCCVCGGKRGCAFFMFRSHSKFLCSKLNKKIIQSSKKKQKTRGQRTTDMLCRMQATSCPADFQLLPSSCLLSRSSLQISPSGWP